MYLKKGDVLIREGEESKELYWLLKGKLVVSKKLKGHDMTVNTILEGQLVGELSFIDQKVRSATVTAMEDCQVMVLDYDEFKSIIKEQPKWIQKLLTTLSGKVRELSEI
jgi:CRP-like cAMP-binding protein